MSLAVKTSQVAGTKPMIGGKCLAISFRVVVVTRRDDGPANQHFADAVFIRLIDLDLDAIERCPNGSNLVILKASYSCRSRSLRQSIALQDSGTEPVKIFGDFRIETGPSRNGEPQLAAEGLMNGPKEKASGINTEPIAYRTVNRQPRPEENSQRPT